MEEARNGVLVDEEEVGVAVFQVFRRQGYVAQLLSMVCAYTFMLEM